MSPGRIAETETGLYHAPMLPEDFRWYPHLVGGKDFGDVSLRLGGAQGFEVALVNSRVRNGGWLSTVRRWSEHSAVCRLAQQGQGDVLGRALGHGERGSHLACDAGVRAEAQAEGVSAGAGGLGQVSRPCVHEFPSLRQQCPAAVGCLRLVRDGVCECHLQNLAREVSFLAAPIPEA